MSEEKQPRKASSVRHTRAIQKNRIGQPIAAPSDDQIKERIQEIVHPATLAQVSYFHRLGLRERTLSFVVMVAFVLEMIWRQIGSVSALTRLVQKEAVLWEQPKRVSQQALSQRLTNLPSELFLRVLLDILPVMRERWMERERPLSAELLWAAERYRAVLAVDGSTLDALIRKIGLLQDLPENPLAGRMTALLDLCTRLPEKIWYERNPNAHDQGFWTQILSVLKAGSLLIFDKGYVNFTMFSKLTQAQVQFITRGKTNLVYTLERALIKTAAVHDYLVWIGNEETRQQVRLIEILYHGKWYRYITNELDDKKLPTAYVVALYWQRWRIEDAYNIVKRLLGLAYFWCGAQNAVEMQIWATWLLYVVLIDLTDAVAEALNQPFSDISIEMVYRSLYFFTTARQRGETNDVVAYLAVEAKFLGIMKRKHKAENPSPLVFIPNLLTELSNPYLVTDVIRPSYRRHLMKPARLTRLLLAFFALTLAACGQAPAEPPTATETPAMPEAPANPALILATTTSTQDSGLLDVLVPMFQEQTGYIVQTVAVGTGAALAMAEDGNADVLLVHAPASEKALMDAGWGKDRMLVMYNDFVIVGPADDPASIKGTPTAVEAFQMIADAGANFITRGDDSGTNKMEISLWGQTSADPNGQPWYIDSGQGMGATMTITSEKQAYTLTDRATYLANKENLDLEILVEGDAALLNVYHVITVNPAKWPKSNYDGAIAFAKFMTAPDTQAVIGEFGVEKFGQPLFFPDADKTDADLGLD